MLMGEFCLEFDWVCGNCLVQRQVRVHGNADEKGLLPETLTLSYPLILRDRAHHHDDGDGQLRNELLTH